MTRSFNWYAANPKDFFQGTIGLDGEVKGAYRMILDLIYMHDGRLQNDRKWIGMHLGYSPRKTGTLIDKLIDLGKLKIDDQGMIFNDRVDRELAKSPQKIGENSHKTARSLRENSEKTERKLEKSGDPQRPTLSDFNDLEGPRARVPARDAPAQQDRTYNVLPSGSTNGASPSDQNPPIDFKSPKDVLWQDYITPTRRLLGMNDKQTRSAIGKLLKQAGGDANTVIDVLDAAIVEPPFDPMPWLMEAIKGRTTTRKHKGQLNDEFEKLKTKFG